MTILAYNLAAFNKLHGTVANPKVQYQVNHSTNNLRNILKWAQNPTDAYLYDVMNLNPSTIKPISLSWLNAEAGVDAV